MKKDADVREFALKNQLQHVPLKTKVSKSHKLQLENKEQKKQTFKMEPCLYYARIIKTNLNSF